MRAEKGLTLVETIMTLAIMGVASTVLLSGLAMTARSNITMDRQTTAESLARAQMEYILSQTYDSSHNPPQYAVLDIPDGCAGYTCISPMAVRLDPAGNGTGNDDGLQKITVVVQYNSQNVYTIEGYKIDK